jgi:hypothetical protein
MFKCAISSNLLVGKIGPNRPISTILTMSAKEEFGTNIIAQQSGLKLYEHIGSP